MSTFWPTKEWKEVYKSAIDNSTILYYNIDMAVTPFNPAQHGRVIESYSSIGRNGILWFLIGTLLFVLSIICFVFRSVDGLIVLSGIFFGCAIISLAVGITDMASAQSFNSRVRHLKSGGGLVARGTIQSVRHTYRMLGRTRGTRTGDSIGIDTGWFFKVTYVFEDDKGRQRRSEGIIPCALGPKRRQTAGQTFLDPNAPRVGMFVDVLFDNDEAAILRLIQPT